MVAISETQELEDAEEKEDWQLLSLETLGGPESRGDRGNIKS